MTHLWQTTLALSPLGISVTHWFLVLLILLLGMTGRRYLLKAYHLISQKIADHTETSLDNTMLEAAEKPVGWLLYLIIILISLHMLQPEDGTTLPIVALSEQVGRVLSMLLAAWFVWRLIDGLAAYGKARAEHTDSPLDDQLVPFISSTLKIFLVITAILVLAQNMGYSVSGLIASLGIGGIAVAMAAKDTISNIFGSIMILTDRPFTVGDWIKTSQFEGVVEEVGFRSTRIRTFAKTLVNVPNSELANMVVDNIDARSKRRIKMRIGITYDTSTKQMKLAIAGIEKILKSHPGVDQEYTLVKFDEFEESSLSIFLYYFSASTVWEEYLQVRQEVNLEVMELLESMQLAFAFPSQTIYLEGERAE